MRISFALLLVLAACKPSPTSRDAPIVVASVSSVAPTSAVAVSSVAPSATGTGIGLGSIPDSRSWNTDGPNDVVKKPDGPRGNATLAPATFTGGTVPDADRVVAGLRPRFRQCFQQGLNQNPKMAGKVAITAKIDPTGDVSAATGTPDATVDQSVASCMANVTRRATFSSPGGAGATMTFTATLEPQTP